MDFDTNKVKTYITSVILTFMGMMSVQMSFMYAFFEDSTYSVPVMIVYTVLISLVFCAGAIFVKHKWIMPIAVIVFCAITVWMNFYEIAGGFGIVFNTVADAVSEYFYAQVLYIAMTSKMIRIGDIELFSYIAIAIITLIYSYTISTRKALVLPLLITLASVGMPVFVEIFPPFFAVLSSIVYCVELIILSSSVVLKNHGNRFNTELVAIISGVFLMLCGGVINVFVPHNDFEQSEFFVDFNENVQREIDDLRDMVAGQMGEKSPSSIGAGKLGHVNKLTFSGEEVLTVRLPEKKDTIYLKGYIGEKYDGNKWIEPTAEKTHYLFSEMENKGYNQIEMVGAYLEYFDEVGAFNVYKAEIQIKRKDKSSLGNRYFSPIYPTPYANIYANADGAAEYISDNARYEYCSVSGWDFLINIPDLWHVLAQSDIEKKYREYVKNTYLDVNTTMADELKEQWGSYSVETARDRLMLAMDIREYLDDNCTYTTSPGRLPARKDFVEHFLKDTQEGYCTYFATAAVMMFRSAGVPARYVEGYCFKVGDDESDDGTGYITTKGEKELIDYCEISVKDSNAHAWVEFYVDGIGWIDFEVTPGSGDGMGEVPEPETEEPTTEDATTEENTTDEPETEEPTTKEHVSEENSEETTETDSEFGHGGGNKTFRLPKMAERIILIVFISIVIITVIIMSIRIRYLKHIRKRENVYNDDLNNLTGDSVMMNYQRFECLMKYSGFVKQPHMTYMDFARLVEQQSDTVGKGEACRLVAIYEKVNYSQVKISKEEIEICNSILDTVYDRIYGNVGLLQKFILLYILNY